MRHSPTIVIPGAGTSRDLLDLAASILRIGLGQPVLLGRKEDFLTTAEILGLELKGARFIFPVDDPVTEELVDSLSRGELAESYTQDQIRAMLLEQEFLFATALLETGRVSFLATAVSDTEFPANSGLSLDFKQKGTMIPLGEKEGWLEVLSKRIRSGA